MEKEKNIYVTSLVNKNSKKEIYKLKKNNYQEKNEKLIKKRSDSILSENNKINNPTSFTINMSSNVVNQNINRNNSNYNIKISKIKVIKKSLEFNLNNQKKNKHKKIDLNVKELPPLKSNLDYSNLRINDNYENENINSGKFKNIDYKPKEINHKKELSNLIPDNSINDEYNKLLKYEMNNYYRKNKSKPFKMH